MAKKETKPSKLDGKLKYLAIKQEVRKPYKKGDIKRASNFERG